MNRANSNLDYGDPRRNDKLFDRVDDFMFERYVRRDMNVERSTSIQELVGQPGAISQDAVCALIIRQGGVIKGRESIG